MRRGKRNIRNCWGAGTLPYLSKIIDIPVEPVGYKLDLNKEGKTLKKGYEMPHRLFVFTSDKKILAQVTDNLR
jgi:hypothetical protein